MPVYEYRCGNCKKKVSVFFRSFADADQKKPTCEHCASEDLTRVVSQVAVTKSLGQSMDLPDRAFDDVDESNSSEMTEWIKDIKRGMGDPNPQFGEGDLMDAGINPHADEAGGDHASHDYSGTG